MKTTTVIEYYSQTELAIGRLRNQDQQHARFNAKYPTLVVSILSSWTPGRTIIFMEHQGNVDYCQLCKYPTVLFVVAAYAKGALFLCCCLGIPRRQNGKSDTQKSQDGEIKRFQRTLRKECCFFLSQKHGIDFTFTGILWLFNEIYENSYRMFDTTAHF